MRKSRAGWLLTSLGLLCGVTHAADDTQEFRRRNDRQIHDVSTVSSRAQALGGSYAALSDGAAGVYENPAALGATTDHEGITDLGFDYLDDQGQHADWVNVNVGGVVNLNKASKLDRTVYGNHTAGLVYQHRGVDYDTSSLEGDINSVIGAYGRSFRGGRFFGGSSLAYHTGDWDGADNGPNAFEHYWRRIEMKVGGIYRLNQRTAVGSTLMFGAGEFENKHGYLLGDGRARSVEFRTGFANQINRKTLMVGDFSQKYLGLIDDGQGTYQEHHITRFSNGLEYSLIKDKLVLRGGWYWEADSFSSEMPDMIDDEDNWVNETLSDRHDNSGGITLGFGYYYKQFEFGYGVDIGTTGDVAQTLNFELDF